MHTVNVEKCSNLSYTPYGGQLSLAAGVWNEMYKRHFGFYEETQFWRIFAKILLPIIIKFSKQL